MSLSIINFVGIMMSGLSNFVFGILPGLLIFLITVGAVRLIYYIFRMMFNIERISA